MMNVLIIGSGAREHAITKALSRSAQKPLLYCCGSTRNPGIESLTTAYWVGDIDLIDNLVHQALLWAIDLVIIGPEAPLALGLADALCAADILVIGPKRALAAIESSKSFARDLMREYAIPGLPQYKQFTDSNGIPEFLNTLGQNAYVIKANGLMAGKGVKVAGDHLHSFDEAIAFCQDIFDKGQTVVIEEKLIGQEFSFLCFADGNNLFPMPLVQDNKRAFDGDKGPNTGGMGSFSAADHGLPFLNQAEIDAALKINQQVFQSLMKKTGEPYIGILYGGFIATAKGVFVIEFNARFGDPEALNVLSVLDCDFFTLCMEQAQGLLKPEHVRFAHKATVCKYAVPQGYPDNPQHRVEIDIHEVKDKENLYLAAVDVKEGILYATGSRTVAYVGIANTTTKAEKNAEEEISRVKGPLFHRHDIGTDCLIESRIKAMKLVRSS